MAYPYLLKDGCKQVVCATVEKATGIRYEFRQKESWNQRYYSFDNGATWNKSRLEAWRSAKERGALVPARY